MVGDVVDRGPWKPCRIQNMLTALFPQAIIRERPARQRLSLSKKTSIGLWYATEDRWEMISVPARY